MNELGFHLRQTYIICIKSMKILLW